MSFPPYLRQPEGIPLVLQVLHWRIEGSKQNTQATVRIAAAAVVAGLESHTPLAGPTGSEQVSRSTALAATEYFPEDRRDEDRDIEPFG